MAVWQLPTEWYQGQCWWTVHFFVGCNPVHKKPKSFDSRNSPRQALALVKLVHHDNKKYGGSMILNENLPSMRNFTMGIIFEWYNLFFIEKTCSLKVCLPPITSAGMRSSMVLGTTPFLIAFPAWQVSMDGENIAELGDSGSSAISWKGMVFSMPSEISQKEKLYPLHCLGGVPANL